MSVADPAEPERLLHEQYISCNTSGTILNICAILSKLNKHQQAHEYAMQAIDSLKKSLDLMRSQITNVQIKRQARDYPAELDSREAELQ